jgi:uncharacterized protein (DUF427 family)
MKRNNPNITSEDNSVNVKSKEDHLMPESVWDYPRPPKVEDVIQPVKIKFNDLTIADSLNVKRVLERGHPPVYYFPLEDINSKVIQASTKKTWCEWKGEAKYFDVQSGDRISKNAAWFYPNPTQAFKEIKDYVAFYAGKMDACYVGDELVKPQAGDFYGGWITSNIEGPFKGSQKERV